VTRLDLEARRMSIAIAVLGIPFLAVVAFLLVRSHC
jgi:hypothetical protein